MSKFLNISAVLLLLLAITFTRCQKQDLQQNQVDEQTVFDPTINKILKFEQTVENPTSKNNDLMSVDSAVWYIEALLNYQYGIITDSSEVYYETKTDSAFFNINTTAGKIEIMDVVSAFYEIETVVVDGLKDIKHQNKRIDIVDIEYKNEQFVAYFQYNYGEQVFGGKYLYNIWGDWEWGHLLGNCSGQYVGEKDASTEISLWLKYNRGTYYATTWTDVELSSYKYISDFPGGLSTYLPFNYENLSPYGVDLFFMEIDINDPDPYHYCIWQNLCNTLALEANHGLTIIENNLLPNNHNIKSYNFSSLNIFYNTQGIDQRYIFHYFEKVRHGIPNSVPIQ